MEWLTRPEELPLHVILWWVPNVTEEMYIGRNGAFLLSNPLVVLSCRSKILSVIGDAVSTTAFSFMEKCFLGYFPARLLLSRHSRHPTGSGRFSQLERSLTYNLCGFSTLKQLIHAGATAVLRSQKWYNLSKTNKSKLLQLVETINCLNIMIYMYRMWAQYAFLRFTVEHATILPGQMESSTPSLKRQREREPGLFKHKGTPTVIRNKW